MSELAPNENQPLHIEDETALRGILEGHGFNVAVWGAESIKSVWSLWHEIAEGESEILSLDGELVRRTHAAAIDVAVQLNNGQKYLLYEEKHVYKNGTARQRNLITSIAEKIKPTEDTDTAVRRALAEELGIVSPLSVELAG